MRRLIALCVAGALGAGCTTWHPISGSQLAQIAAEPVEQRHLQEDGDFVSLPEDATLTVRTLDGTYERPLSSLRLLDGHLLLRAEATSEAPRDLELLPGERVAAGVSLPAPGKTVALSVGLAAAVTVAVLAVFLGIAIGQGIGSPGVGG